MGLVKKEEKDEIILSDILGDEDHLLHDMDFKIAALGTPSLPSRWT